MSSQTKSPGTVSAGALWVNPDNVKTSNNTYASETLNPGSDQISGKNYGFTIPTTGVTILGVKYEPEGYQVGGITDTTVKLLDSLGFVFGDNKANTATPSTFGGVDGVIVYGGTTDMWGLSTSQLTPAVINDADFGIQHVFAGTNGDRIVLDHMPLTVYYAVFQDISGQQTQSTSTVTGSMSVDRKLVEVVPGVSTATGAMQADKNLQGSVSATSNCSTEIGLTSQPYCLAGTADAVSVVTAAMAVFQDISGQQTQSTSTVTGSMSVDRKMVGTVDGLSTAAGAAQADKQLAAPAVAAVATVASDVGGLSSNPYTLAGTVDGVSSTTAAMEKFKSMVGTVDAVSVTGTADLEKPKRLLGEVAALSVVSGAAQMDRNLVGAIDGLSTAPADLGITHVIPLQSKKSFWFS